MKNKPFIVAISGVKNSGKTTLITKLITKLTALGYKVATIKHDGHDFEGDVPGTDSFRHKKAGAYGTAVFSNLKFMIIKEQNSITEKELINNFKEADFVLLEGFKSSNYPKIEVVREEISRSYVCEKETIIAIATTLTCGFDGINTVDINDIEKIIEEIFNYMDSSNKNNDSN